jgi:hypothetical protein
MKKSAFILLLPILLLWNACTDVLERKPDGVLEMDEILADPDKVEGLLNACYMTIPRKGITYNFFEPLIVACSDDAYSSDDGQEMEVAWYYRNNNTARNHYLRDTKSNNDGGNADSWASYWTGIRRCTQFIELAEYAAMNDELNRGRFKAEARVMRAFFYMELIKLYGKLPIMDEVVSFDFDFSATKRASVYEVARYIAADCDSALNEPLLPWRTEIEAEGARATKALACAVKVKALLFAASPLHNEGQNHWEEAYQTAREAIRQLKDKGYELFRTCTQPDVFGTGPAAAFRQLVCQNADFTATPRDRETIYQIRAGGHFVWHVNYIGSYMPNAYKCGACPTQELVDAFETLDGEPVLDLKRPYLDEKHLLPNYNTNNTMYDSINPYINRDPRLDQTVLHNGSRITWDNEAVEIQTHTGGAHAPSFDISNRAASRTGYYHCKMVTPGACGNFQIPNANWRFYRLGETLLDFAEIAAEAGYPAEARTAANEVRNRSGMPDLPANLSGEDLILRIHNERRVELAWEETRFFDLRRRQKPDGDLSETCKWFTAMVITQKPDGTLAYSRQSISSSERGGWQNRDLLFPLPAGEASLLDDLTGEKWQNPGW